MTTHFINGLQIIGFTEVPSMEPPLPRILSAIYFNPDSKTVLYPPYQMVADGSVLVNPVQAPHQDFLERAKLGDLTSFAPTQAQVGWALWFDDGGSVHYEPKSTIARKLAGILELRIANAKQLLAEQRLAEARTSALIASAIAPQNLEPLLIRAAAEYGMSRNPDEFPTAAAELNLTEFLASELMVPMNLFVEAYRKMYGGELREPCKITGFANRQGKGSRVSQLELLAA